MVHYRFKNHWCLLGKHRPRAPTQKAPGDLPGGQSPSPSHPFLPFLWGARAPWPPRAAPLSFLLKLRRLSHAEASDHLKGDKVADMFGQLRQIEVQDAGMVVRPLRGNHQDCHHLRPPGWLPISLSRSATSQHAR
jgi:hypothetical protein